MSDGLSTANADAALATIVSDWDYEQLHTGAPGSAGTANVSSTTTREAITWGSPSAGSVSATDEPEWVSWTGSNGETVTDTSGWSASTSGTFEGSEQLSASVVMDTGDDLTLTENTITIPVAA
ncbi:MAG: phage tail fiber protein [Streptosporangiaceae bacterium]